MSANVCKEITLKDVARAAGVSMATVSRSLNNSSLIPERTRKRIREIADGLGFDFNAHARSLITRRVGTIGIILPPHYDQFGVNLYHGTLHNSLRSVLESNDIDLLVSFMNNHASGGNNIRKLVARKKVDGLIIVQPVFEKELVDYLRAKEMPFVFSHYPPPDPCLPDVDIIYPDNEYGGFLAGQHLASLGKKRVLCLTTSGEKATEREFALRLAGVRRGLLHSSISLGPGDLLIGNQTMESGYDAVMAAGDRLRQYDAILALNDLMAIGALLAAGKLGLRVPEDVVLMGYDDTDLAACIRPTLTTIHQPREELSLATCERLLELIRTRREGGEMRDPQRTILTPRLVIRETTSERPGPQGR